jgi:folate-dependent phosphoribosylglycinamide formyltransferase PurN
MGAITPHSPLTIALIGETSLLTQCASLLVEDGHHIICLCSSDRSVIQWASDRRIPYVRTIQRFYQALCASRPQYILSIINPIILSHSILLIPSMGSINYHDSLLPKYAGSNATMWARFQGKKHMALRGIG